METNDTFLTNPPFSLSIGGMCSKNIFLSSMGTDFYKSRSASCRSSHNEINLVSRNPIKTLKKLDIDCNHFVSSLKKIDGKNSYSQTTNTFLNNDTKEFCNDKFLKQQKIRT